MRYVKLLLLAVCFLTIALTTLAQNVQEAKSAPLYTLVCPLTYLRPCFEIEPGGDVASVSCTESGQQQGKILLEQLAPLLSPRGYIETFGDRRNDLLLTETRERLELLRLVVPVLDANAGPNARKVEPDVVLVSRTIYFKNNLFWCDDGIEPGHIQMKMETKNRSEAERNRIKGFLSLAQQLLSNRGEVEIDFRAKSVTIRDTVERVERCSRLFTLFDQLLTKEAKEEVLQD